jgi:hypothetical protein
MKKMKVKWTYSLPPPILLDWLVLSLGGGPAVKIKNKAYNTMRVQSINYENKHENKYIHLFLGLGSIPTRGIKIKEQREKE